MSLSLMCTLSSNLILVPKCPLFRDSTVVLTWLINIKFQRLLKLILGKVNIKTYTMAPFF